MSRLRRLTLFVVLLVSACSQKPSVDSVSEPSSPAPATSITLTPISTYTPHPTFSLADTALSANAWETAASPF